MMRKADLQRRLAEHMKEHRLKSTRQRDVILEVFQRCSGHVAVDELLSKVQEEMPSVGYATVYRTMKLFVDAGVAQERRFADGQCRYEVASGIDEHHDHIICVTCGHIFEFEDPLIEQRQELAAAGLGLKIVSHRHDIYAECQAPAECATRLARLQVEVER